ncbi:transporter substrate-binding domain-containing protein [Temperatibacter marinus]|uniref:Transporter substrate-binding domain-containing protein n=1 Tax=Temperatibacter marinus TaxID=1456591 RepID=A0AA52EIL7_9PROT|nr:transporter substrate-binding domain-containing protein [Temperatibacter marinus]WND03828.1 transporter substrate-binding domain-containing protein [Temperatibacter marinus]
MLTRAKALKFISSLFLCTIGLISAFSSNTKAEDPLVFGLTYASSAQSKSFARDIISQFCADIKQECKDREMSVARILKTFRNRGTDIVLFYDHTVNKKDFRSANPIVTIDVWAIVPKDHPTLKSEATIFDHKLGFMRSLGLEKILNFEGDKIFSDSLNQALNQLERGRMDAFVQYGSEIQLQTSIEKLSQKGYTILTLIEDLPLFAVMDQGNSKGHLLKAFSDWMDNKHHAGILYDIYQKHGLSFVYPYGKNWKKWMKSEE